MLLRALDLFSGCGGLSHGLIQAGIEVLAANEVDQWAGDTYATNHPNVELMRADIRSIDKKIWKEFRGQIDLIAGGPPCQGFSVSGRRQFGEIPSQNTLIEALLKVVEVVEPNCVLIENVAGFRTAQMRLGVKAFAFTVNRLRELGYDVRSDVIQAADFGVPSLRSRVCIAASRTGFRSAPIPEPTHASQPHRVRKLWVSCREALEDLPQIRAGEGREGGVAYHCRALNSFQREMRRGSTAVQNHVAMRHTERLVSRFAAIPPGGSSYRLERENVTVYKSNNQRLVAEQPSLCITANFQSTYIHPWLDRNLTAREAARLMTFPDAFEFRGKRTLMSKSLLLRSGREAEAHLSQYNQIGNAVPPRLAKLLGEQLQVATRRSPSAETRVAA